MIDASFLLMTGTPPIWDAGWETRVHPAMPDHGKHRTVEEMVHQRIGRTTHSSRPTSAGLTGFEAWLADLDPVELDPLVSPGLPGADRQHLQAHGWPVPRASPSWTATECWIYQHGLRHMWEIELARGLVGLGE